jgi:site-specific DNA-cytosine methylase
MKQRYAIFEIGGQRVLLTREELIQAVNQSFEEPKQSNFIFCFSIQEMDEDTADVESIRHDNAEMILKYKKNRMKILVNCEESQAVTIELRQRGFEAYSCDLQDCSGGYPEWHIKGDAIKVAYDKKYNWDMMIAFPPCTHLAVSGARHFEEKIKDGRQQKAIDFFLKLWEAPINKICIENPIGIMSTILRKPDQIIQPWQFGHGETKSTCFWLKNLNPLKPTNIVDGREQRIWKMPPGPDRGKLRSKTYKGVAKAMAEQWTKPQLITKQLEIF